MKKTALKKVCAIILLGSVIIFSAFSFPTTQKNIFYPFRYRDKVEQYAEKYQVDKFLAVSVMKVESNFAEGAISRSGAIGLMQIMPETAHWIAYRLDEDPPSINELHDSDRNIKYGIWYLADLEEEFNGNDVLALAAYNAGRGNVWNWIEQGDWQENFSDIDAIPYLETRNYVKKVLNCREKYQALYESQPAETLFVGR